jgi:hypothetical protein
VEFYATESAHLRGYEIRRDTLLGNSGALCEDIVRTRALAEHCVRLLNKGLATVERHRSLGCRIVPIPAIAHIDYGPTVGARMLRDVLDDRMFPDDGDVLDPFHL